jgi:hypothetical protein
MVVSFAVVFSVCGRALHAAATMQSDSGASTVTQLSAGAARVVITPTTANWDWREVHDDLFARALALKSGDTTIVLVNVDLGSISKEVADRAKQLAQGLTQIPAENILIATTHTHYAPFVGRTAEGPAKEYQEWLPPRIADAIWLAQSRLRPARVAHGSGSVPGEVFNRRYWMKDGKVWFNPPDVRYRGADGRYVNVWQSSDIVRPAGPTDPEVGVLVVMGEDWKPIAVVANYALHYVGGPHYEKISADYFGYFERALQRMAGAEFVGIMFNGTCGDVNNEDYMGTREADGTYRKDYELGSFYQVERVSNVVAAEVFRVWQGWRRSQYRSEVPLGVANDWFRFQFRRVSPEEVAQARDALAGPEADSFGDVQWLERVHARAVVDCAERGPERVTQIQAFRIGDLGVVTLPGEIFVEYGLQIKKASPFAQTLVCELANDSVGYVPTDRAMTEGSYEVLNSRAAPGTEGAMVSTATTLLKQLAR